MSVGTIRRTRSMTEAEMVKTFTDLAYAGGGFAFHIRDARRQAVTGLTDLVLAIPPVVGFIELKTQRDTIRPEQARVLDVLSQCTVLVSGTVRPVPKREDEWSLDEALDRLLVWRPDLEVMR